MQYKTVGSPDSPITGAKWQTIQQNNSKLSIKNPLLKNVLSLWSPLFKKVAEKEQKTFKTISWVVWTDIQFRKIVNLI